MHRRSIEAARMGYASLSENAFILLAGDCPLWANAHMDPTFVANRRQIGRLDFNHSHLASLQIISRYRQCMNWEDVSL